MKIGDMVKVEMRRKNGSPLLLGGIIRRTRRVYGRDEVFLEEMVVLTPIWVQARNVFK